MDETARKDVSSWKEHASSTLVTMRYAVGELVVTNLLWALFTVLIVTIPPAFAGLYYATNQIAHEKKVTWRTFFIGFRTYFWPSWRWFLANALFVGVLIFNILYSGALFAGTMEVLRALYLPLLFAWLLLQLYSFPLLLEQEEPRLLLSLRNSLLLWIAHLPFNLMLTAFVVLLVVISIYLWPSWILITAAFIAYVTNSALLFISIGHRDGD